VILLPPLSFSPYGLCPRAAQRKWSEARPGALPTYSPFPPFSLFETEIKGRDSTSRRRAGLGRGRRPVSSSPPPSLPSSLLGAGERRGWRRRNPRRMLADLPRSLPLFPSFFPAKRRGRRIISEMLAVDQRHHRIRRHCPFFSLPSPPFPPSFFSLFLSRPTNIDQPPSKVTIVDPPPCTSSLFPLPLFFFFGLREPTTEKRDSPGRSELRTRLVGRPGRSPSHHPYPFPPLFPFSFFSQDVRPRFLSSGKRVDTRDSWPRYSSSFPPPSPVTRCGRSDLCGEKGRAGKT